MGLSWFGQGASYGDFLGQNWKINGINLKLFCGDNLRF